MGKRGKGPRASPRILQCRANNLALESGARRSGTADRRSVGECRQLDHEDLASRASLTSNAGTFGIYLSRLRSIWFSWTTVVPLADALLDR